MNRLLTALIALAFAGLAQAAEPSVATKTGNAIKKGAEKTGEVVGTTVERTKEGVKKGAKKVKAAVTPASAPN